MNFEQYNNKNEFYWEREFRKDDSRIAVCMREIPSVIDLPEEDELLKKRLQKQLEYTTSNIPGINQEEPFDFEDIMFPDNWRERESAIIYSNIEALAKEWAAFYAVQLPDKFNIPGVRTLCLYGKILGYAIDMLDTAENRLAGLKIALCKRILSDINSIINEISPINVPQDDFLTRHLTKLNRLRHNVLNIRFKLKNETDRNK